jgi:hypothetical protein
MVIDFFKDIFQYEKFPVEYRCFQQLENVSDINYVAIPWTQILNSGWLNFPGRRNRNEYLKELASYKINQYNNFTVCQHDDYMQLIEFYRHLHITTVFSPLHNRYNNIEGIDIIPIPFTNSFTFEEKIKDIDFSFVGAYVTHPIRRYMKEYINGDNIIYRNDYHVGGDISISKPIEESEYKNILERSKFSICPRGSSPSSVRFWESIAAGAIPILVSDDWVLPEWDWDNTILKISEDQFTSYGYDDISHLVDRVLNDCDRYNRLQTNCKLAANKFKSDNFKDYILKNL